MGLTPTVIEEMSLDQIYLMTCSKEWLETGHRTITGTPQQLKAKGLIDELPTMSAVQAIRQKMKEDREAKEKKEQRAKGRRERLEQVKRNVAKE